MSVKFKVVPVTRWRVVRVEDNGNSGGASTFGTFDSQTAAERVGKLLAAGEDVAFEGIGLSAGAAIGKQYQPIGAQLPPGMSGWQDLVTRSGYVDQANAAIFEDSHRKAEQALSTAA